MKRNRRLPIPQHEFAAILILTGQAVVAPAWSTWREHRDVDG